MQIRFTGYNRPDYFEKVIDSWNNVRGIEYVRTSLHLEPSRESTQRRMTETFKKLKSKSQEVVLNNNLQGVLVNPWLALTAGFCEDDFVILAEDDVIVSSDVLEYFRAMTGNLKHSTLAVCAFGTGQGESGSAFRSDRFNPLIWGTTQDRWLYLLRDTWDKNYSTGNPDGSCAGWDHNIQRIMDRTGMHVLRPGHSRSDHIGEFEGTHMTPELFSSSRGPLFKQDRGPSEYNYF